MPPARRQQANYAVGAALLLTSKLAHADYGPLDFRESEARGTLWILVVAAGLCLVAAIVIARALGKSASSPVPPDTGEPRSVFRLALASAACLVLAHLTTLLGAVLPLVSLIGEPAAFWSMTVVGIALGIACFIRARQGLGWSNWLVDTRTALVLEVGVLLFLSALFTRWIVEPGMTKILGAFEVGWRMAVAPAAVLIVSLAALSPRATGRPRPRRDAMSAALAAVVVALAPLLLAPDVPKAREAALRASRWLDGARITEAIDRDDGSAVRRLVRWGLSPNVAVPPVAFSHLPPAMHYYPWVFRMYLSGNTYLAGPPELPLIYAVAHDKADAVTALLASGADPNGRIGGMTAAQLVARYHPRLLARFIDSGVEFDRQTTLGTAYAAASNGDLETIRLLWSRGADPNSAAGAQLQAAVIHGDASFVAALLAAGARPNTTDNVGPLSAAASAGRIDLITMLVKAGADVRGATGDNALRAAARAGHLDAIRALVQLGASLHSPAGQRAIGDALGKHHRDVAVAMLDLGAAPDPFKDSGQLLFQARAAQDINFARTLIERGANVNARNLVQTILISTVEHGDATFLQTLIDAHAEVNAVDFWHRTALDIAMAKQPGLVKMLLRAGARPGPARPATN